MLLFYIFYIYYALHQRIQVHLMFYNPSLIRQDNNTKHLRTELKKIMIITQHTHAQKNNNYTQKTI